MDTELLTYRELAERLGMKPESARKTAQRKGWHRTVGNDGLARVIVPVEAFDRPERAAEDVPPDNSGALVRELEARIEVLKDLAASERGRAEAERRRAEAAEADRDAWRANSETLLAHSQRGILRRLFG